jgi:hypothetical protein
MKVKRMLFVLCLISVCMFAGAAFAAKMEFKSFSIEVPKGWQVEEDGGSNTVAFTSPGSKAVLTITVEAAEGESAQSLAQAFAKELNGDKPEKDADDGSYSFSFTNDSGAKGNVFVQVENDKCIMVMVVGEHEDLSGMIESLQDK